MNDTLTTSGFSGKPTYWIAAGIIGAMAGYGLDLASTRSLPGSPAVWGALAAMICVGLGALAVARQFARAKR